MKRSVIDTLNLDRAQPIPKRKKVQKESAAKEVKKHKKKEKDAKSLQKPLDEKPTKTSSSLLLPSPCATTLNTHSAIFGKWPVTQLMDGPLTLFFFR